MAMQQLQHAQQQQLGQAHEQQDAMRTAGQEQGRMAESSKSAKNETNGSNSTRSTPVKKANTADVQPSSRAASVTPSPRKRQLPQQLPPDDGSPPSVYGAVYSNTPVFEMVVRGIGLMRRRADSWLNATQILKLAGIEKSRRTKILDKDIAMSENIPFEKVQGGYGKYQGTWIPLEQGKALAEQYNVLTLLKPLLEYNPDSSESASIRSAQGAVAKPQSQKAAQKEQLAQAQNATVPSSRVNGKNAMAIAEGANADATTTAASRKRPRAQPQRSSGTISTVSELSEARPPTANTASAPSKRPRLQDVPEDPASQAPVGPTLKLRKSNKLQGTEEAANVDSRNLLIGLFLGDSSGTDGSTSQEQDPAAVVASFPPGTYPDTPIDDQMHTALHWAAALGRVPTVRALLSIGADVHRGNGKGETPLMRAVLVTNNFDTESFAPPGLLSLLYPSIGTKDDGNRTVLHQIALVSGIKGRSASARHYLEAIMLWLSEHESPAAIKELVDAQDDNGDTALCIAARVGSRPCVRILLEANADRTLPNKLGLRPGDFGLVDEGLVPLTQEETAVANIAPRRPTTTRDPNIPATQYANQLVQNLSALLGSISTDFGAELQSRAQALERTKQQLQLAAKDLADQRQHVFILKEEVKQVELTKWRIRNLEQALEEEDAFDWSGRSNIGGEPAFVSASAEADAADPVQRDAFEYRGPSSTLGTLQAVSMPGNIMADPRDPFAPPQNGSNDETPAPNQLTLAQQRRLVIWYERVLALLEERIEAAKKDCGEMELDCRKVVKLCTGLDTEDDVENLIGDLITALESDGPGGPATDLQRVSNFMAKVRSHETAE